ncbi:MAG: hypothetical protein ACLQHK_00810 [Gallionellaceae bacterium]
MSYRVYIALDGFKETPISLDAWLAAARQCDDVIVVEEKNRHGKICHFVILKGDKRARLDLSPEGLVYAQNPSRELIVAMFKLSNILNAGIYSERKHRYDSVEDWERRNKRRAKVQKDHRFRIDLGLVFAVLLVAIVWLLVEIIFHVI